MSPGDLEGDRQLCWTCGGHKPLYRMTNGPDIEWRCYKCGGRDTSGAPGPSKPTVVQWWNNMEEGERLVITKRMCFAAFKKAAESNYAQLTKSQRLSVKSFYKWHVKGEE